MDTIKLTPNDLVGIDKRGLIVINGHRNISSYYNPDSFNFKCANETQQQMILRASPRLTLKQELQQLTNIDRLKKKLITYFNSLEKYKYLSSDDKIIKHRNLIKSKAIIKTYIKTLNQDKGFTIEKLEHQLRLCYKGNYVKCVKVVSL